MKFTIGTRGSNLAIRQAEEFAGALLAVGVKGQLKIIKTQGDLDQVTPIEDFGGAGVFVNALNQAVLDGDVDCAVHSCKDLPTRLPVGLVIGAVLPRADPWDVIVGRTGLEFLKDPSGKALIATSSVRRRVLWQAHYPLHHFAEVRGNIETRLHKLQLGEWNGLIMARAALVRIQIEPPFLQTLEWMLPALGQGIIAITVKQNQAELLKLLQKITHKGTFAEMTAERAFMEILQMGCNAPVAGLASRKGNQLLFRAKVYDQKNQVFHLINTISPVNEAVLCGKRSGLEITKKMNP